MRRFFWITMTAVLCMMLFCGSAMASDFSERVSDMNQVKAVRVDSAPDRLQITVETSKTVVMRKMVLSNPDRIVVDIKDAWLSPKVKKEQALDSRFAGKLKIAQFDPSTVRVVVESKVGSKNYQVIANDAKDVMLSFGQIGQDTSGAKIDVSDVEQKQPVGGAAENEEKDPIVMEAAKAPEEPDKTEAEQLEPWKAEQPQSEMDRKLDEITGLKGKIITIDAGHGGNDPGAIGPTGVMEKKVTLRVALALQELLQEEGASVYMTRTTDTEVSPKKAKASDVEELQARCDVANRHKSDIFVSIHMDSFSSSAAKGTTGYYYSMGSVKSRNLADKVRQGLIAQINTPSRGTQSCNFYVVKHTDMPATLVEVAFISNSEEEKLLNSEAGIKKAAQGIADGIADYFG